MRRFLVLKIIFLVLGFLLFLPKPTQAVDCSKADVNADGNIRTDDILAVQAHFAPLGDPNFDSLYDQNFDNQVNTEDVDIISECYDPSRNISIPPPELPESRVEGFQPESFIADLISAIIPIVLGIAGFLTVIFVIISGIQFITSSGNPEAAGAARSRLTFAIIGFVIIILAFAITQIVDRIFLGGTGVF